jgi:hypothetical protein
LPALLRNFIRTHGAGALFGLRLGQARRSRVQRPEEFFAVLPGGVEDGG